MIFSRKSSFITHGCQQALWRIWEVEHEVGNQKYLVFLDLINTSCVILVKSLTFLSESYKIMNEETMNDIIASLAMKSFTCKMILVNNVCVAYLPKLWAKISWCTLKCFAFCELWNQHGLKEWPLEGLGKGLCVCPHIQTVHFHSGLGISYNRALAEAQIPPLPGSCSVTEVKLTWVGEPNVQVPALPGRSHRESWATL